MHMISHGHDENKGSKTYAVQQEEKIGASTCADCRIHGCWEEKPKKLPGNCPGRKKELLEYSLKEYQKSENHRFFVTSSEIEKMGYGQWTRIRETIEFCKRMNYKKIGIAFCKGLREEAKVLVKIFRRHGFHVVAVMCKSGGVDKAQTGVEEEVKLHPGEFEAMCNPIFQATLLNEQETDFNLAVGLCVGHDSLFYKYSRAMVTTVITKDRVLAHNPVGALYCAESYYREKL